ncbi:hypothetical protein [Spartinivicinus poritis]|uniref:Uncharacterized protein n=1 Tax=Spartinivicinus poritis TaxID=2994640 RepID=A0ABT5UBR7_9GAMM|nr:hypothetical protein [Spartinivicinus sp. A2-2]MDE1463772.1 hypothetical protein [Spartinivicinus sp. A2-2]
MICPSCERFLKGYNTQCSCGYKFIFRAKTEPFNDNKMKKLELKASAFDTRYFTRNMLYSVFLKTSAKSLIAPMIFIIIFCGIFSAILIGTLSYIGLIIATLLFGVAIKLVIKANKPMSIEDFADYYKRWVNAKRNNSYLVDKPKLKKPPVNNQEADIFDYGADRIVVVDDPLFVDCLILNEEHMRSKALIVSQDGYPSYLKEQFKNLLEQADNIPVILLHGTNQNKTKMIHSIESSFNIKLADNQVYDLGYYEEQIKQAKSLYKRMRITKCTVDMLPYPLSTQLISKDRSQLQDMLVLGAVAATASYVSFSFADDFG